MLSSREAGERYFALLDADRREKVRRCRREEDKKRSLLGGYLIQAGVRESIYGESGLRTDAEPLSLTYTYGENGKPYLRDFPSVFFSLSHSGQYVLCAVSDGEVGADIQRHCGEKKSVAERFFSQEDREAIQEGARRGRSPEEMFYRIWAVKEAYLKLTGEGLRFGMEGIASGAAFEKNGRVGDGAYYMIPEEIENYSIAVCSRFPMADIVIRRIS